MFWGYQGEEKKKKKKKGVVVKMASSKSMDLFRSEEMMLVQLIIPAESAHDTVTYVGELGLIQFKDVSELPVLLIP